MSYLFDTISRADILESSYDVVADETNPVDGVLVLIDIKARYWLEGVSVDQLTESVFIV